MSMVINTNVMSLQAQQNLSHSQMSLQTSVQRLSSGMRINTAADDAAGLAIASRFTAQINGGNQAVNNANDGISLAQTAGGALSSITNSLQRIRQLAVQSANGTNSSSDRSALNQEATQLLSEVNRQANGATFNGVNLLNGSSGSFNFQVGANTTANDVISVTGLPDATTKGLGLTTDYENAGLTYAAPAAAGTFTITPTGGSATTINVATTDTVNDIANKVNASGSGVFATVSSGKLNLISATGFTAADGTSTSGLTGLAAATKNTSYSVDLSTQGGAQLAIGLMDTALQSVNNAEATLGATQNRFTQVVASLQTTTTNLSAARSAIQDTNFAAETANMTQANILQQAGTAVLAQANSLPKTVLSLLQNL
jgi:flagellin